MQALAGILSQISHSVLATAQNSDLPTMPAVFQSLSEQLWLPGVAASTGPNNWPTTHADFLHLPQYPLAYWPGCCKLLSLQGLLKPSMVGHTHVSPRQHKNGSP